MKFTRNYLLPAFALAAFASQAWAEKEVVIRRIEKDAPRHIVIDKDDDKIEKEKVTYLGVETAPMNRTLGAQLGLPKDIGLIVINVMEKSPAADVLKEDDVLVRLDDQLLIDMHQLGVLVRAKKEGEEVKLTVVRGGKEMTVKAKLAVRELPRQANAFFFRNGEPGGATWNAMIPPGSLAGLERLRDLPGMDEGHAQDVLRMIGRERQKVMSGHGVRVFTRKGTGSTMIDLPKSNISYSDDDGSIEIKVEDGKRNLTMKDAKGTVMFDGPINTDEERKKLPAEVSKRLEKLDADTFEFEVGEDFKPEVVPLPPQPTKTKIRFSPGLDQPLAPVRPLRSL